MTTLSLAINSTLNLTLTHGINSTQQNVKMLVSHFHIVMLSVIMLNDVMLSVIILSVIKLSVNMLNVVILNVVMLSVIMLSVLLQSYLSVLFSLLNILLLFQ